MPVNAQLRDPGFGTVLASMIAVTGGVVMGGYLSSRATQALTGHTVFDLPNAPLRAQATGVFVTLALTSSALSASTLLASEVLN